MIAAASSAAAAIAGCSLDAIGASADLFGQDDASVDADAGEFGPGALSDGRAADARSGADALADDAQADGTSSDSTSGGDGAPPDSGLPDAAPADARADSPPFPPDAACASNVYCAGICVPSG